MKARLADDGVSLTAISQAFQPAGLSTRIQAAHSKLDRAEENALSAVQHRRVVMDSGASGAAEVAEPILVLGYLSVWLSVWLALGVAAARG